MRPLVDVRVEEETFADALSHGLGLGDASLRLGGVPVAPRQELVLGAILHLQ